ncbi:MAG: ASCH domain-containing protein [Planctomycetota bacterium]
MEHIAILDPLYVALIVDGTKTIEARLLPDRRAPFGRVTAGDTVYLKPTGQAIAAVADVRWIRQHENLTPSAVDGLAEKYHSGVCAPDEFWTQYRHARCALLIRLQNARLLEPHEAPAFTKRNRRSSWECLCDTPSAAA